MTRVKHTSPGESPGLAAVIEIFRRLLIGVCAPAAMLIVLLALIIAGARGSEEQARHFASAVFWASFVAVPGIGLANCWVIFRAWPRGWRLFGAGMLLPIAYAAAAFVAVHATTPLASVGLGVILKPFHLIFRLLTPNPHKVQMAGLAALVTLVILTGIAALLEWRRLDSARSPARGRPEDGP
jgi:hypothetical protein